MAETEWARRVMRIANEILDSADPSEHHEAINWGDLSCVRVERQPDRDENGDPVMFTEVYVEEASPDAAEFGEWLKTRLDDRLGSASEDKFVVITDW